MDTFIPPLEYHYDTFTLRAYRPGDGAALQRTVNASYEHLRQWMIWAKPNQSLEESEAICRRFAGQYHLNQGFTLGVWRGEVLVGGTGYHLPKLGLEDGNAEIGMWIAADEASQGLGTRTLRVLLDWGFSAWPWQRLFWRCDTRNLASARTAQKAGMILEGTFRSDGIHVDGTRRDTHLFARLRTEYSPQPPQ